MPGAELGATAILVAGPDGGVALLVYNADGSSEWRMELSDDAVADNVRTAAAAGHAPARTWCWPTEKAAMRRDRTSMRLVMSRRASARSTW